MYYNELLEHIDVRIKWPIWPFGRCLKYKVCGVSIIKNLVHKSITCLLDIAKEKQTRGQSSTKFVVKSALRFIGQTRFVYIETKNWWKGNI